MQLLFLETYVECLVSGAALKTLRVPRMRRLRSTISDLEELPSLELMPQSVSAEWTTPFGITVPGTKRTLLTTTQ
jgi:hypothetical protein